MIDKADRSRHFPAIEKRYGKPMSYWFAAMKKLSGKKYPEQIAHLRERYGFSQAHGNAVVMYSRGSKSSRRYNSFSDYLASQEPVKRKTIRAIFAAIKRKYPKLELVIAWNQPMLKYNDKYIFGVSAAKNHLLIAPFDQKIIRAVSAKLAGYKVNKKTIQIPADWKVDSALLHSIIKAAIKSNP